MPGRARVPAGAEPEPRSPRRQRWAEPAPGAHWAPRLALLLYEKLIHAFVKKKKKGQVELGESFPFILPL